MSVDESEGAATGEDNRESELYTLAVERGKAVESVAVKLDQIRQIGDRIAQHPGNFSFLRAIFFVFRVGPHVCNDCLDMLELYSRYITGNSEF